MTEKDICNLVVKMLSDELDESKFGTENRSTSYLSLIYKGCDVFRVKYTDRSKWISIRLTNEDMDKNDVRFEAQKNKNQMHWKADIESEQDIYKFKKEILDSCKEFGYDDNYVIDDDRNHSSITFGFDFENNKIIK